MTKPFSKYPKFVCSCRSLTFVAGAAAPKVLKLDRDGELVLVGDQDISARVRGSIVCIMKVCLDQSAVLAVGAAFVSRKPSSRDEASPFLGVRLAVGQDIAVSLQLGLNGKEVRLLHEIADSV